LAAANQEEAEEIKRLLKEENAAMVEAEDLVRNLRCEE
jgi:hypothetical protein